MMKFVDAERLERLKSFDGSTLANAIETFDIRLRNEGFADGSVRYSCGGGSPALGHAVTARIRCSTPPPVGHRYHDRTDWWSYIVQVPSPRFVVVQDIDERPGFGAFVGEVHAAILLQLGCVAYATNGSVRDIKAIGALPIPFFASTVAVSHAFAHLVDFGGPVDIGGLKVESGDLLFGDGHGLQSIPLSIVDRLPGVAADLIAKERTVIQLCESPDFSLEKLRHLVRSLE
jgi:4-hydroxy-4-methyl-2-oxoglutarate aldolase